MLQPLRIPDAYYWSAQLPDEPLAGNAYFLAGDGGNVLIDPVPAGEAVHRAIAELGGVATIALMTASRQTVAREFAARYGAKLIAETEHRRPIAPGIRAIRLPGQRRPSEYALALAAHATVVAGDALRGTPAGALSLPPEMDESARRTAALGLRAILCENPTTLLLSVGQSLWSDAYAALYDLLYAHAGAEILRINLDELEFRDERSERRVQPPQYTTSSAEVGFVIGARRLGFRVSTLDPGRRFCPLHGHAAEEELFFVIDGAPSVRTLSGTIRCRKGDFIALPVGQTGTHQLLNESDAPATVLLLGRTEPFEVCYYPDSDKLLVDSPEPLIAGRSSVIVKGTPDLDYFHDES